MSLGEARRRGVPEEKFVYLHAHADAHEEIRTLPSILSYTYQCSRGLGARSVLSAKGATGIISQGFEHHRGLPAVQARPYGSACRATGVGIR